MIQKEIASRIIHKHDIETNWNNWNNNYSHSWPK